ncbi:MAG: hypothetical protein COU47_01905 [Candidatus Niyogibacteria bacterium CG10_big_fil_rev_8_21_14_0_10_46_36]|uniref:PKD domain-containing protein n=1 Tax=Candidatus Niyogibacteria bacterium CG10_big_fil_rev_8_21_14_0_10_46_36 TaxID=1974726 RepID=A0A2H0TDK2_9BACT|nr:MAG: hypothetical protein COU47_01905 [Candidatus Niyogibacteria bacterium CG10_big_fil_rev_8_21_14_0_10_46_36]
MKPAFLFFIALFLPLAVNASVGINEVAWMGTETNTADEWIELFSTSAENLDGWILEAADGSPIISFSDNCPGANISAGGFFLLERTDDESVPGIPADCIYVGALGNGGEALILRNSSGAVADSIDASAGWPAGDSATKQTMQKSGNEWVTADGTPRTANAGSGGAEAEDTADMSAEDDIEYPAEEKKAVGFIEKKNFGADAGGDTVAIVGVEKLFEGRGYDLDGDPLESADFLWTFGDGASARGMNVRHTFVYPGTYRVVFDVSSGIYNASDAILITVILPPLSIAEVKPGTDGFVELHNTSEYEMDISYWGIGNGALIYYFPHGMRILPRAYLVVPYTVSGVEFFSSGDAALYYPNGIITDSMQYGGAAQYDESFHVINGDARLGIASPGSERFVARAIHSVSGVTGTAHVSVSKNEPMSVVAMEEIKQDAALQTAAAFSSAGRMYEQTWFWFAAALLLGALSGIGIFVARKFIH